MHTLKLEPKVRPVDSDIIQLTAFLSFARDEEKRRKLIGHETLWLTSADDYQGAAAKIINERRGKNEIDQCYIMGHK